MRYRNFLTQQIQYVIEEDAILQKLRKNKLEEIIWPNLENFQFL